MADNPNVYEEHNFRNAFNEGEQIGYDRGHEEGYDEGYEDGYKEATQRAKDVLDHARKDLV